jgi:predicted SnoaL-like aldol condensation-catalyzing enzyme
MHHSAWRSRNFKRSIKTQTVLNKQPLRRCYKMQPHSLITNTENQHYWRKIMQAQIANDLATNKRVAKNCLDLAFNQKKPEEAVAKYIAPNYKQHNPHAPDGPDGVVAFANSYIKANPQLSMEFKRIIAEGEYVVIHSHQKRDPKDVGDAVVDIFRVQDGKLVEHWDVLQPVPAQASNRNTMF